MRIRQIKPEFWKDTKLVEVSEGARLFYIGAWQLCDDAGWFRWSLPEIGAELYPFDGRRSRERKVQKYVAELAGIGRLLLLECGHAQVPKLTAHQHLAGTTSRVVTIAEEHRKCMSSDPSPRLPATPRDSPRLPAPVSIGSVGIGSVSDRDGIPKSRKLEHRDGQWVPKAVS